MTPLPSAFLRSPWPARLLRLALIVAFGLLVARHWHPHYGFTRLLQCDADVAGKIAPALRDAPIYVHADAGSYDGFYYAEIATDPTLRAPGLAGAVDDLGYRARRILLSAIAWVLGRGDPIAAVHAYAWLNLGAWLLLAAVLWRILPGCDGRSLVAWAGVLFSTGSLLSVRFALTDLTSVLLLAAALQAAERERSRFAPAVLLALAALARETALLGLFGLLAAAPGKRSGRHAALTAVVAVLPLAAWLAYVHVRVGPSGAGLGNFTWPLLAAGKKAVALAVAWRTEPNRLLVLGSILAYAGLLVPLVYLGRHPRPADPWWRVGAAFGGLLLCLGPAVWGDDLPGAAVRVLLPLTLAFNVLAVRQRAGAGWLVLANLSIVGGVWTLWPLSRDPHEFAAGRFTGGTYVVHTDEAWYPVEQRRAATWVWSRGAAALQIDLWPRTAAPRQVALQLNAFSPREVEIWQGDTRLWRGPLAREPRVIDLGPVVPRAGRIGLQLRSEAPATNDGSTFVARDLAFSLSGVRLE